MFVQENAHYFLLVTLAFHAALAGVDVLLNHEWLVQLPRQYNAALELRLHSAREMIFGLIFTAIAWGQWHGVTAWFIVGLLLIEFVITVTDTVVEVDTRKLPITERINHVFLYINYGFICLSFAFVWAGWSAEPTAIIFAYHGVLTWILTLAALGAMFFCIRDATAAFKLSK